MLVIRVYTMGRTSVPIEPNRTELLVRFGFGSSNLSSGSGSVHQISVQVRVRFIKPWFRFGFGSSNLGSGSVRFIEAKVWFGFGSVHQISVQVQVRFGSIM